MERRTGRIPVRRTKTGKFERDECQPLFLPLENLKELKE
jgi:hypothetical protein